VQGLGEVTERRLWLRRLCQVGTHPRVRGTERAVRADGIAAAGDGEGDEPGAFVGQDGQDGFGVVGGVEVADHRPDDPRGVAAIAAFDHREEAVLWDEGVAHGGGAQADADLAPSGLAGPGQIIEVHRLVRAMESTHTEVHHGGCQRPAVVIRHADPVAEGGNRPAVEVNGGRGKPGQNTGHDGPHPRAGSPAERHRAASHEDVARVNPCRGSLTAAIDGRAAAFSTVTIRCRRIPLTDVTKPGVRSQRIRQPDRAGRAARS
jgi:hypothetical protein